jgi:putative flavoprotein involved in K+ transport
VARDTFGAVVVGGGQAGLATGYHLRRRGIDHVILDANDDIGAAWRNRWDSLRLFTPGRYSGLPGMPYPGPARSFPGKDDLADYLADYAARFDLPVRTGVAVDRVAADGGGFLVASGGERLWAHNVVVATGAFHHPRVPALARGLGEDIVQLHSSEYRRPAQLREGDVLVVGAGSSGSEIALELAERHQVWLSGRDPGQEPTRPGSRADRVLTPLMWFMASRVIDVANPLGRKVRDHFLSPPRGIPRGRVRPKDLRAAGVTWVPRTTATADGARCWRTGRCWTSPTWCGARASWPTTAGSTFRCSASTGTRSTSGAWSTRTRASTSWVCPSSAR